MNQVATGIDHPIFAVRDMMAGRASFERLGFTITPRGRHMEWGTGNWCIMFERDYLEIRGIIDPSNPHNLARVLEKGEGLMGMAFGTDDARTSCRELTARGFSPRPVRELTRSFELPDGAVQPRFSLCFLDEPETPGLMSVVFCQHLTPELLRRPEWLRHANGACGVRSVCGVVPDVAAAASLYTRMFGAEAIALEASGFQLRVNDQQKVSFLASAAARDLWPTIALRPVGNTGYLLSVTLDVTDVETTKAFFYANGISYEFTNNGKVQISPADSCGALLEFVDRESDRES